eukprot:scaffold160719_cov19-Tisochrysis_lutea.AAC.1
MYPLEAQYSILCPYQPLNLGPSYVICLTQPEWLLCFADPLQAAQKRFAEIAPFVSSDAVSTPAAGVVCICTCAHELALYARVIHKVSCTCVLYVCMCAPVQAKEALQEAMEKNADLKQRIGALKDAHQHCRPQSPDFRDALNWWGEPERAFAYTARRVHLVVYGYAVQRVMPCIFYVTLPTALPYDAGILQGEQINLLICLQTLRPCEGGAEVGKRVQTPITKRRSGP